MRTLDEVIKAYEIHTNPEAGRCITDCPYHGECVPNEEMKDALHYLKEYQKILPLVPSLINTALEVQKKGKTIG